MDEIKSGKMIVQLGIHFGHLNGRCRYNLRTKEISFTRIDDMAVFVGICIINSQLILTLLFV